MFLCIYVCVCVCICVYVCISVRMYAYVYLSVFMYVNVFVCVCMCVYVCVCIFTGLGYPTTPASAVVGAIYFHHMLFHLLFQSLLPFRAAAASRL